MNKLLLDMIDDLKANDLQALEEKNKEYVRNIGNFIPLNIIKNNHIPHSKQNVIKNMHGITGLWYIKKYLSYEELNMIKKKLNNEIILEPITALSNSRRVAHYGKYYSCDRTGLKDAQPIPDFMNELVNSSRINNLVGFDLIDKLFEQVIINEYKPGQQISYHTDHTKLYGPVIACITVGQSVPIKFECGGIKKKINIEEGSMYIMTDESRYEWKYSLRNNSIRNSYSLTYRTINEI